MIHATEKDLKEYGDKIAAADKEQGSSAPSLT